MDERSQKSGRLLRITYQNAENNFLIGRFEDDDLHTFTAIGTLASPQPGLAYELTGEWVDNEKYGRQFRFDRHRTIIPKDPIGIYRYLIKTCKFIGPKISEAIIDRYGKDTIDILKTEPDRVASDIKGITPQRANEIKTALLENEENEQLQIELEGMLNIPGIRKNLIFDLIDEYRSDAPAIVRANPYILTEFHGVGFVLADRIAIDLGIDPTSIHRKKAALIYVITEEMQKNGHTWVEHSSLKFKVNDLISTVRIDEALKELQQVDCKLIRKGGRWTLAGYFEKEQAIAEKVARFMEVTA